MVRLAVVNMTARQIEPLREPLSQIEQIRTYSAVFALQEEKLFRPIGRGAGKPVADR
jgi:hypothetical protein